MVKQIDLGEITVDVTLKKIKHVHLRVHPTSGRVRVSAPLRTDMQALRTFLVSKVSWIKKQQNRLQAQASQARREYLSGESHYAWGKPYRLKVEEVNQKPGVELKQGQIILRVRPGANRQMKQAVMEAWYREQLKTVAPAVISKWEKIMGVKVERLYVRQMKTRWGSCSPTRRSIRLNSELAKKPGQILEYVVVHELAHLLEPTHNEHFKALMDRHLPDWRSLRQELKRTALGDVE